VTRLIRLDADGIVHLPAEVIVSLREGEIVVCPTDTLYGLAVDPLCEAGLSRLVTTKHRDAGKPVPLLLSGPEEVERWARHIPESAGRLMERFWPGALTVVLPAAAGVHRAITGGGDTVGLRVPDHPVPRALARGVSGAITGTSANRGGEPGAWEYAEQVVREFAGEVAWVLWDEAGSPGEHSGERPGSTVVGVSGDLPVLYREGAIPFRDITEFLERG
jgi:L-threonylcarbamoyladenylate synthase